MASRFSGNLAQTGDVGVEEAHFHHRCHQHLVEMGRAEIDVSLLGQHRFDQLGRQDAPTDADPGRIGLGKGPGVNHAIAVFIQGIQAGHVVAVVAQFAIGRVFDQVNRVP